MGRLRKVGDKNDEDPQSCDENCECEENQSQAPDTTGKTIRIPGKKGKYVQNSSSIHKKYAAQPISLSKISLAQFSTLYYILYY
jgi:hypothetical protein